MSAPDPELARLRGSIDNLDSALVCLLAERFKITQRVGELKAELGLPPADPQREAQQIERLRRLADEANLDPEFAEKFLTFIVSEVVRDHERIARSAGCPGRTPARRRFARPPRQTGRPSTPSNKRPTRCSRA